jgi:hypothetical protein
VHKREDLIYQHVWTSGSQRVFAPKVKQLNIRLAEDGADVRRNVQQNVMCCDMYRVGQTKTVHVYFSFVDWSSEVLIGELIIKSELANSLIALKVTLPCPDDEGLWVEQVCSYSHFYRHCIEVSDQFHAPIYTRRKEFSKLGASETVRRFWRREDSSCPCQHSTARLLLYPSYSTFICRTNRLPVTLRARQAPGPVMFALPQLPRTFYSMLCLPAS